MNSGPVLFSVASEPNSCFCADSDLFVPESGEHSLVQAISKSQQIDVLRLEPTTPAILEFNNYRLSPSFSKTRLVAAKIFQRWDSTGTYRGLERDLDIDFVTLQVLTLLIMKDPKVVWFDVSPHQPVPYLVLECAKWLKIPTLFFQPCSLVSTMIPRSDFDLPLSVGRVAVVESDEKDRITQELGLAIDRLIGRDSPLYIVKQRSKDAKDREVSSRFGQLRALGKLLREDKVLGKRDFTGHSIYSRWHWGVLALYLLRNLKRSLAAGLKRFSGPVPAGKYALFALHYEPERTVTPEGLPLISQFEAVIRILGIIGEKSHLVVKEHSSQVSSALRGWTGRSPELYRRLAELNNVTLVDSETDVSELIDLADCVFTVTGTIALEAVLGGRPVAYFGNPWWEGLPGATKISEETVWSDIISAPRPGEAEVRAFLIKKTMESMVVGINFQNVDEMRKRFFPVSDAVEATQFMALKVLIKNELSKSGK